MIAKKTTKKTTQNIKKHTLYTRMSEVSGISKYRIEKDLDLSRGSLTTKEVHYDTINIALALRIKEYIRMSDETFMFLLREEFAEK